MEEVGSAGGLYLRCPKNHHPAPRAAFLLLLLLCATQPHEMHSPGRPQRLAFLSRLCNRNRRSGLNVSNSRKETGATYPRNGETSCTSSAREITSWLKITRQRRKFSYASVLRRALRTLERGETRGTQSLTGRDQAVYAIRCPGDLDSTLCFPAIHGDYAGNENANL